MCCQQLYDLIALVGFIQIASRAQLFQTGLSKWAFDSLDDLGGIDTTAGKGLIHPTADAAVQVLVDNLTSLYLTNIDKSVSKIKSTEVQSIEVQSSEVK